MKNTMKELVQAFPQQLAESLAIAEQFHHRQDGSNIRNIVICGLGGSGIGATIFSQLVAGECKVPITAVKDYDLPAFVSAHTLLIACSYSGNTEETLASLEKAASVKAQIACVSSGGKVIEIAQKNNWPYIQLPGGYPPRAAFAFSIVQLFAIASAFGLVSDLWKTQFRGAIGLLEEHQEELRKKAKKLAEDIHDKLPVIYADSHYEGVAIRWRQQINENSKMLCWHHVYPEMTHNELVGWRTKNKDLAVVFLHTPMDHPRTQYRMELTREVYQKYTNEIHDVHAMGNNMIEMALSLIHIGDWLSVKIAKHRGMDDVEVKVIDWLKGELAKK